MSRSSFLVLLGGRRSAKQSRRPNAYARLTSAVLENPVAMLALIVADSECGSPISELAANARILNAAQDITGDAATDLIGATALGNCDHSAPVIRDRPVIHSASGARC